MSFSLDVLYYTPIVFLVLYLLVNFIAKTPLHVCIVVLGDIGRSPRMQYHALSFAKEGFRVYLVGYRGSTPHENVLQNENITIYHVSEPPHLLTKLPRLLGYLLKVMWMSVSLGWTLLLLPKMSSILIQNPPSIPTIIVAYFICLVRFCTLVIDWHNYGHTILAMALKTRHPLVRFANWYERVCGRLARYNLCVTFAMEEDLSTNWNIKALAVHDTASANFKPVSVTEQHDLFLRLGKDYTVFLSKDGDTSKTALTEKDQSGNIIKSDQRPALLVSSTSWTEDEDFGILLEALEAYDSLSIDGIHPVLLCVITGKGPQKGIYKQKIMDRQWNKVQFCLPWLSAEDYPKILGSADIGVCLHKSSSGVDLPMKVVDMFGCGLPVCAINYECIDELVKHAENGLVFNDNKQLSKQLMELLKGFPENTEKLDLFRRNLAAFQRITWHEQWKKLVKPIFVEIGGLTRPNFGLKHLDMDKKESTTNKGKKLETRKKK